MSKYDLMEGKIYTDAQGRYRKIVDFYNGFDGERRVKYRKMGRTERHGWYSLFNEPFDCTKETFANWAKFQVKESEVTP